MASHRREFEVRSRYSKRGEVPAGEMSKLILETLREHGDMTETALTLAIRAKGITVNHQHFASGMGPLIGNEVKSRTGRRTGTGSGRVFFLSDEKKKEKRA